jgi:hypothetical protein
MYFSERKLGDKASVEVNFRQRLEQEARELTDIGNNFMIRHHESGKIPIHSGEQVDYLFHRLFALIHLLFEIVIAPKMKVILRAPLFL